MNMEDELEETEIEGFDAQTQTLFCQNVINDLLIQVPILMSISLFFVLHLAHKQTSKLLFPTSTNVRRMYLVREKS